MVGFRLENFGGMLPRTSDRLLPNNFAAQATNLKLQSGELRGIRKPTLVYGSVDPSMFWAYRIPDTPDDLWIEFAADADVVRSPLADDTFDRYYWTEQGVANARYNTKARIANGDPSYRLGVPRPTTAPTVTPVGGTGPSETRSYVYTFVNIYGEESRPSEPTVASGNSDGSWDLSNLETNGVGGTPDFTDRAPADHKNIYRTQTAASGVTVYKYVDQVPVATTTYNDTKPSTEVASNNELDSTLWAEPPDNLQGLIMHPNGFAAGFVNNALYFSVPYRLHAWPVEFVVSTEYPIVGLGVFGNSVAVMTEASPYLATGIQPQSITLTNTRVVEPCLSKTSIVNIMGGTYYASQNGLVVVHSGGVENVTLPIISKEEWERDYNPASIRAARYQTMYIGIEDANFGFKIDTQEQRIAIVDLVGEGITGAEYTKEDQWSGEVYLYSNQQVFKWDDNMQPRVKWTWRSKEFQLTKPVNMGACQIFAYPSTPDPGADNELISLKAFVDLHDENNPGVLVEVFNQQVQPGDQVRLPSGFKSDIWQFQMESAMNVKSLAIAETGEELANV